jgi:hypothetical protein
MRYLLVFAILWLLPSTTLHANSFEDAYELRQKLSAKKQIGHGYVSYW